MSDKEKKRMSKNDRRVRKTKKTLQESLAELFSQKRLEKISIRELVEHADVHRSTFYAHYVDIFALYAEIEDKVIVQLSTLIQENFSADFKTYYQILFDYCENNRVFCKMLFSHHAPATFLERLTELFKISCLESWKALLDTEDITENLLYLADYHVQGSLIMVRRWAESDFSFSQKRLIKMVATIEEQIEVGIVSGKLLE